MSIVLPVILQPISRRKDKSVCLKFDTRELNPTEMMTLFPLEGSEGYILYSPNKEDLNEKEIPKENSALDTKTPSQRLRSRIFVHYHQAVERGEYIGLGENFYKEQMEKIIEGYSRKNLEEK